MTFLEPGVSSTLSKNGSWLTSLTEPLNPVIVSNEPVEEPLFENVWVFKSKGVFSIVRERHENLDRVGVKSLKKMLRTEPIQAVLVFKEWKKE